MAKMGWKDMVAGWTLKHPKCLTTVSDLFRKLMGPASWPGSRVVGWALGCLLTPGWFTRKGSRFFPG